MNIDQIRTLLLTQRKAVGWSQEELAERSGVSVRTIRNLETGTNRNPRRVSVELLLAAFEGASLPLPLAALAHFPTDPAPRSFPHSPHAETEDGPEDDGAPCRASWRGIRPRPDSMVGRQADLRHVLDTARRSRLVVLTGPGGVGKTRLALAAAEEMAPLFRDGVAVVELGSLTAEAGDGRAAFEEVRRTVDAVVALDPTLDDPAPADVRMLLVIDNAEHVIDCVSFLTQRLLDTYPGLQVLVTSRRPLNVFSADAWDVAPLEIDPLDGRAPTQSAAVELFLRRTRSSVPTLDLGDRLTMVAEVCRRLAGLPLAIEIAAHRLRSVPLEAMLREGPILPILDQVNLGGLSHHRPLSGTVKWGYDLLDKPQRSLLHHLAHQPHAFTIEDVVGTAPFGSKNGASNINLLAELVDASMVQVRRGRNYEYHVLGFVREYVNGLAHGPAPVAAHGPAPVPERATVSA
ncbi:MULTISPECIES: helix-turn-helix domain-containing protein [Streptomyces]|uniref:Helix-turn-helix domain-containing protein n=1 Tax=Streptomyces nondiastaticus TaxID=3154512 RepID=A0ABW6TRD8_9ACTN|nr:helix-turn-helix domain-containing protein [Streptomyces sp. VNUA116]WKU48233.1 helix-turn-helix domain-containing protein [Streptomyces sp. VNUA116]